MLLGARAVIKILKTLYVIGIVAIFKLKADVP